MMLLHNVIGKFTSENQVPGAVPPLRPLRLRPIELVTKSSRAAPVELADH